MKDGRKISKLFQRIFLGCISVLLLQQGQGQIDTLTVCNRGETVQLNGDPDYFAYRWTPALGLDNPTIARPNATVFSNSTYVVEILTDAIGENLIVNPGFEEGNVGFESDYIFVNRIFIQGVYGINTSAFTLNEDFFSDCPDKTTGEGLMMVVDGSPQVGEFVWCQTVAVNPGRNYAFSSWLTSVNPSNPANLQFSINGIDLEESFVAGFSVCDWRQFYAVWNADTLSQAEICIVNKNTNPNGNDFALDDLSFREIGSIIYDTTVVIVEAIEAAPDRLTYFPNAFSPNFDGFNDDFGPDFGKGPQFLESFQVFDRWGNQVFARQDCALNDTRCRWEGDWRGRPAAIGVYSYFAKVRYADGASYVHRGLVNLVR